jgi:hypothetical protein
MEYVTKWLTGGVKWGESGFSAIMGLAVEGLMPGGASLARAYKDDNNVDRLRQHPHPAKRISQISDEKKPALKSRFFECGRRERMTRHCVARPSGHC